MTRILPGWYLSGWFNDLQHLRDAGCTSDRIAVLDMTCELPRRVFSSEALQVKYHCVPILDQTAPSPAQLCSAVRWCSEMRAEGMDVVVHCAFGHGRSATALVATLLCMGVRARDGALVELGKTVGSEGACAGAVADMEAVLQRLRPHVKLTSCQYALLAQVLEEHNKQS
jgi:hypothetical protein